jgi:hypothetical protein
MQESPIYKDPGPAIHVHSQISVGNWSYCFHHRNLSAAPGICIKDLGVVEIHCILSKISFSLPRSASLRPAMAADWDHK